MPKINPDNITAQVTYDRLRRFKKAKPFTTCYQCSRSQFNLLHECVCKVPGHRGRVINPNRLIDGCPYAKRYTIADALSNEALRSLGFSPLSAIHELNISAQEQSSLSPSEAKRGEGAQRAGERLPV